MILPPSISSRYVWLCLILLGVSRPCAAGELWVTAYYPTAAQQVMPVSEVDFGVVTHVIQFALIPNSDGSINDSGIATSKTDTANLVQLAHTAGRKALICVGGAGSRTGFQGATSPSHRAAFIANLIRSMNAGNYDGIDLDWEPLPTADFHQFTNLVLELRAALDSLPNRKLLTAAVSAYPPYGDAPDSECKMLAALQSHFDQINIMTYDLAGPYAGWVTWFNSPIYDGGARFPSTSRLLPSLDGAVKTFIANGLNPAKLGVGIAFYGDVWMGGTATSTGGVSLPRESWKSPPTVTQLPYSEIMATYFKPEFYHWDDKAQSAYLSLRKPSAPNGGFVSYDDEHTCRAKVRYARQNGLGGVMIWQLGQGRCSNFPAARRDPLINAIGRAIASPKTGGLPSGDAGK